MSRSDWNFLAALAGLAALFTAFCLGVYITALNYPQEERYQSYRHTADQPTQAKSALPAEADSQPFQYRTPCRQPEGQGESDLCAQWRAANATEDSAFWTKWGVWIGIIGSSLLLWQIMLTRKAVEDTSKATEAMREANSIARQTQMIQRSESKKAVAWQLRSERRQIEGEQRTLRAYLGTEDHCVTGFGVGVAQTHTCKLFNRGQTPAYDVKIWSRPLAVVIDQIDPNFAKVFRGPESVFQSQIVIGPGQWVLHSNSSNGPLSKDSYFGVCTGGIAIIWGGVISYRDAFGKRHRTTFKYFLTGGGGALPSQFDMTACSRGNIAT